MGNVRLNVATHGAGFIPWISSLYLQNDGRVGIGVSIPLSATLEIASPEQNADISLFSYNNTTDDRARIFLGTFERSWWIENDGMLNLFKIRDSTAGIDRLIIETDGSVGINTTAPGAFMFAVNGSAAKTGGGTWSVFSDARLKKNIRDLDSALERLLQLRGRTFEFIDPEAHFGLPGQQIGLIAQEVENVFPEWIDEDEDGTRILTIRGFEALTIEALREMQADCAAMIQTQATRIASLERDNAALSQRLARLERMLDSHLPR